MTIFRIFLILIIAVLVSYTGIVIANHGIVFLPFFFGDMLKMEWPGQFNLDFMFVLTLSALWIAWRYRFSVTGIVLACLALFGGSLFLATYLLVLSWQVKCNVKRFLLGDARTA